MDVVDSSSLTLYVTVHLSGIFSARDCIYVMHSAYYNSRGCTLTKKKSLGDKGIGVFVGVGGI